MRAVQVTRFGGPEVLEVTEIPEPVPHDGLQRLRIDAAGINFADTHQAENTYLAKQELPLVPGAEAAGRLDDGRRVVALLNGGGYAEVALVHPAAAFEIPDEVTDSTALSLVIQGTSAWHMLRTSAHLAEAESVVIHAAAGGVGSIAVQLAKAFGAGRVIAVASTPEKRALALELGADVAVDAGAGDLRDALREANNGRPVDVVLEMTGGPSFDASLAALAPFGRLVTYGQASRERPTPVDPGALMARSRAVIGFWLVHCMSRPAMLHEAMNDLIARVVDGSLKTIDGGTYGLSEARRAHEDLRARRTVGKLVLDPRR